MKHVFLFEVLLSPKGIPFRVRVHAEHAEEAALRVQRMHRHSMVRLLADQSSVDGVDATPADWRPGLSASALRGGGPVAHQSTSLL